MRGEYLVRYSNTRNVYRTKLFETEFSSDLHMRRERAIELFQTLIKELQQEPENKNKKVLAVFEVIPGYEGESSINIEIRRDRMETEMERKDRKTKEEQTKEKKELAELQHLQHKYEGRSWGK